MTDAIGLNERSMKRRETCYKTAFEEAPRINELFED